MKESEIISKDDEGWAVKTSKQKNGAIFKAMPLIEGGFSTYKAAKDFAENFFELQDFSQTQLTTRTEKNGYDHTMNSYV